jgi:signal peptidase II
MQAARGASLTSSDAIDSPDDPPDDPKASPAHTRALLVFACVVVVGYALDVVTKTLAVAKLTDQPPVHVVGDLLTFYLARNPGAAFSTGTSYTVLLSLVAAAAALATLWVSRRLASIGWALGLGFLLAGVLGNLTDRIFRAPGPMRGHVVDFLQLPHWPIFNVADMCINVAAAFIIVQAARGVAIDGGRTHARRRAGDDPPDMQ